MDRTTYNLIELVPKVYLTFVKYRHEDIDAKGLIQELRKIETAERRQGRTYTSEMGLWFRFHKDDTLATTISDLERTLVEHNCTQRTIDFYNECIDIAIDDMNGIRVHFS